MLVIKLDEHTGEAGMDTRVEAFIDMLERRVLNENYNPHLGNVYLAVKSCLTALGLITLYPL